MRCHLCDARAIILQPPRCEMHFVEHFERVVKETIERFDLVHAGQRIAVAASGGKDSLTVLHLLARWYPGSVTAITVDEGIVGYREHTMRDLERACARIGVPIRSTSYAQLAGKPLDAMLKERSWHPCTLCGTLRRHLLSLASRDFDVLATGHNADDEAQTIVMNLVRGNADMFLRGGPKSGVGASGFTQRVKPLYFCTEKEVMTYAHLHGFVSRFSECPNAPQGYRWAIREELSSHFSSHPSSRARLLERFLRMKRSVPAHDIVLNACSSCGEPTPRDVCKACEMLALVRAPQAQN
jgi:uncharacterized protein (TIGR00269 family)